MPDYRKNQSHNGFPPRRIQFGLITAVGGFLVLMVGAKPELFLLDRSPVLGFIQVSVMLVGLALMCIGGYVGLTGLWKGERPSIAAEIGKRVISTGYIIADLPDWQISSASAAIPIRNSSPYFGDWQARGVQIAEGFIHRHSDDAALFA